MRLDAMPTIPALANALPVDRHGSAFSPAAGNVVISEAPASVRTAAGGNTKSLP